MTDLEDKRREALIQAGLVLASELSLPAVLQKIVNLACDVADARYGALGVLDRSRSGIEAFITHGVTEEERRTIGDLPHGRGILGALIEEAHPLRLPVIQHDPRSVGFPPNHPPMTTFLGVPVTVRGSVFGNLYLTEKRGGDPFTEDDERAVATLAVQAGVAIENARLYEEAHRHTQRLEALHEVASAVLEGSDLTEALRLIAGRAREMVGAALATIMMPAPDDHLVVRVAVGARSEELLGMTCPAEGSISQLVMGSAQPLVIPALASDPRVNQPIVAIGGAGPGMFVPLTAGGRAFGTLLVANLEGEQGFTEEDLDVVRLFAAQASVALEYARFRGQLARLAVLEDRERIAQELHDGVIQSLFAVGMSLQATGGVTTDAEATRARLDDAVEAIDKTIRDLRNYIFGLEGGAADVALGRALKEVVETYRANTETAIALEVDATAASLLSPKSATLVQAAREALSNALRHAGARTISIRVAKDGNRAFLEVEDDGAGFDPSKARKGRGLENLRARAEAIGGQLEIGSSGSGTVVRLAVPV